MNRPLLPVALLYVAGVLAAEFLPCPALPTLGLALIVAFMAIAWTKCRAILLYPLIFLTGCANAKMGAAILSPVDLRHVLPQHPEIVSVRGTLSETPTLRVHDETEKETWRTIARLEISEIRLGRGEWQPATGKLVVSTAGMLTNLFADQKVEVVGVSAPPKPAAARGLFDYREFLQRQGIYFQVTASSDKDWQILSGADMPPMAERFRTWARKSLALGLPEEDESMRLEWALTLGWKTALTEDVSEPFVRAATYHIFAVDGLRMAIVFGIFFYLFRALSIPRAISGLVLIPLIWGYVALTGWPASAIRSSVMLTILIGGWALKRPSDLLNSLFAAALIILLWQPQQLFQAGFQLSFFVVLCMILIVPILHNLVARLLAPDPLLPPHLHRQWHPVIRVPVVYAWDILATSFAAWIGSLPLVAYYFNIVTPVSTPANLLAVPLCALVLISNLASLMVASWFPFAAVLFNHAGWALMEWIRLSSHWFAAWPRAYFYIEAPTLLTSVLYYALLLGFCSGWLLRPAFRAYKLTGVGLSILLWSICSLTSHKATHLDILALNSGTAIYYNSPGSKNDLLIDCGTASAVNWTTKPFLRAQGVNSLPNLLLTHGNVHQVGGAQILSDLFPIQHIWASPAHARSPAYRQAIDAFSSRSNLLHTIARGDDLCSWKVLHPDSADHFSQSDDNAVVLSGNLEGTRILLLSQLGRSGQSALLERNPDLRADILIAGLPTQTDALSDSLLDAIHPRVVIVTDSEFPVTARAPAKLRSRLEKLGVPILYTRSSGSIHIQLERQKWKLQSTSGVDFSGKIENKSKN